MSEKITEFSSKRDICVVFGSLRSGTTMLRLIMDGHPRFVCPCEADFLLDHLVPAQNGGWYYDLEALAADRIFRASGLRLPETVEAMPAFSSMVSELRGQSDDCLVLILHRGLERLLTLEPHIRILHFFRDPRDVARSAIGMGWAGNVYYGSKTWLVTEKEWEKVAPGLRPLQSLEFSYEELVSSPENTLRKVCSFLEDEYDPEMIRFSENSSYDSIDASLAEQWQRNMTPRELGLIEPLFEDLLIKRGYELSGYPSISPNVVQRFQLKLEHSVSVWRRRIVRYGLRDPLIVSFCEKVGFPEWARPAQKRMDVVTRQYLK